MANTNLVELFTDIADSIRAKDGTTETIAPVDFASRIEAIPTNTGETEFKYRTPDEIYEQDRPSDWPILPDPEEGECYYLMQYNQYKNSSFTVATPPGHSYDLRSGPQKTEWGYLDDNNNFVSVYKIERSTGTWTTLGYWGTLGLSSNTVDEVKNKMQPYYIIKTTGGQGYEGEYVTSTPASSRLSQVPSENILELKINIPNASYILNRYGSSSTSDYLSYSNLYPNLKFITLYNGTGEKVNLNYLCYNKSSLRCLRFDKEENNIFTKEHNLQHPYTATYMFYGATNLQCLYLIDKIKNLTDISSLYYNNRSLPYIEIHNDNVTIAKTVLGTSYYGIKASIILPNITSSSNFSLGYAPQELVNFQLPKLNATSSFSIFGGIRASSYGPPVSIGNVNLLNKYSYKWADQSTGAVGAITFAPECPPPDGVVIDCRQFTAKTLQEMIDTLPVASGASLTIELTSLATTALSSSYLSIGISQTERDNFAQQITDKGYTVSIVV